MFFESFFLMIVNSDKYLEYVLLFCAISCKTQLKKWQTILLNLARVKMFSIFLIDLISMIIGLVTHQFTTIRFITATIFLNLSIISFIFYLIVENRVTRLMIDCEKFAQDHRKGVAIMDKILAISFIVLLCLDIFLFGYLLYEQPSDIFYNIIWSLFFTSWLLGISLVSVRCAYSIHLGERSLLKPTIHHSNNGRIFTIRTINYVQMHQRLVESRALRQRVTNLMGVFPFIWLTMLLMKSFQASIEMFNGKQMNMEIFIGHVDSIIFLYLLMIVLSIIFMYFDANRPKIEQLDKFQLDLPPPDIHNDRLPLDRLDRDLRSSTNDDYKYKVLFLLDYDYKILSGPFMTTLPFVMGLIANVAH